MKLPLRHQVLEQLSDGRFHSGSLLGEKLGISRAAIWKHVCSLKALDFEIYSVPGKGYRLCEPVELLSQTRIEKYLTRYTRENFRLDILDETPSTNTWLMSQIKHTTAPHVCLAEYQPQGRGRHGRQWVTPYAGGLACSLLWRFACPVGQLSGLSLAAGLGVVRTLEALGVPQVKLKWPNDILCNEHKLGGILLEIAGDAAGPCYCVMGIGLNVNLKRAHAQMTEVTQPWTDLARLMPDVSISRNQLAALLIENLLDLIPHFEREGFPAFRQDWHRYDILSGRCVSVQGHNTETTGIARGVNAAGNLLLDTGTAQIAMTAGEITVRF